MDMASNNDTIIGTAGGVFLCMLPQLESGDILKTVILAGIGAVVSFTISLLLKLICKRHKEQ